MGWVTSLGQREKTGSGVGWGSGKGERRVEEGVREVRVDQGSGGGRAGGPGNEAV